MALPLEGHAASTCNPVPMALGVQGMEAVSEFPPSHFFTVEIEGRMMALPDNYFESNSQYFLSASGAGVGSQDTEKFEPDYMMDIGEFLNRLPLKQQPKTKARPMKLKKHPIYYLDTLELEIEDQLFVVPKHLFNGSTVSVNSMDNPIKLDGVSKSDFTVLLKHFYSVTSNRPQKEDVAEWVSTLRLSTNLKMLGLRKIILDKLDGSNMSPAERVMLGIENKISVWLTMGYTELATSLTALTIEDFNRLGLLRALRLSQQLRRRFKGSLLQISLWTGSRPMYIPRPIQSVPAMPQPRDIVERIFGSEYLSQTRELGLVDRILLAREHRVQEWVRSGFLELVERPEDITLEEAEKLGLKDTVSLCAAREEVKFPTGSSGWRGSNLAEAINFVFGEEIKEARTAGLEFEASKVPASKQRTYPRKGKKRRKTTR